MLEKKIGLSRKLNWWMWKNYEQNALLSYFSHIELEYTYTYENMIAYDSVMSELI